jgi:hypothetical protein
MRHVEFAHDGPFVALSLICGWRILDATVPIINLQVAHLISEGVN